MGKHIFKDEQIRLIQGKRSIACTFTSTIRILDNDS